MIPESQLVRLSSGSKTGRKIVPDDNSVVKKEAYRQDLIIYFHPK